MHVLLVINDPVVDDPVGHDPAHNLQEVVVPLKRHLEEVVDLRSGLRIEEPEQERTECKYLVWSTSKHGT